MAMTLYTTLLLHPLQRWRRRRDAERRALADAATDLCERFGPAAYGIAFCSSRQRGGSEHRRFWDKVARRLQRMPADHAAGAATLLES
jgi:hypothetical protein